MLKNNQFFSAFFTVITLLCFSNITQAQTLDGQFVDKETALQTARLCLERHVGQMNLQSQIITTPHTITPVYKDELVVYYVVNFDPKGFVLVSATTSYFPIIAYSMTQQFTLPVTAPAVNMWLQNQESRILHSTTLLEKNPVIEIQWNEFLHQDFTHHSNKSKSVAPFLKTQWNQGLYYNEYCPIDSAGPDHRTLTGCVATAIGQIMHYFRYPQQGTGSYTSEYLNYGTHTVDFGSTSYLWNEMPNKVMRSNQSVSELLYHIGVSVDMNYGPFGSGMWNHKAAHTMKTFFGYSDDTQYNFRDTTTMNWNAILIAHLDNKIPLYYAGWTDSIYESGHAFILDGYQDSTFFHINWGWGGAWDGYFHIDNLIVSGNDFTTMHEVVMHGVPQYNYPYYCNGTDTLTALDGTIDDGSGPIHNYMNNASCSWLIAPFDTISKITLTFTDFHTEEGVDFVRVYNGKDETAPLLGAFSGSTIPNTIVANGKYMYITFSSNDEHTFGGFQADYYATQVKTCNLLTTLNSKSDTISDGSGQYNYQSNTFCRWRIEPPNTEYFQINFLEFDIDPSDYLIITDLNVINQNSPSAIIARLTGNTLPEPIQANTDKIMIRFQSGATVNANGFKLVYNAVSTGINETVRPYIQMFPNPVSDELTILFDGQSQVISIDVFTLCGKLIQQHVPPQNISQMTIHTQTIEQGVYFIRFVWEDGTVTFEKLIKSE
jgi:hypothetical protein